MTIYSVHVLAGDPAAAERAHFERQGFAFAAFAFGPLWLLARRLWRALLVWLIGAALVAAALVHGAISSDAAALLAFMTQLYLGLAGSNLAAAAYERGRWRLADIAVGPDRASAERNFFTRAQIDGSSAFRSAATAPAPPAHGGEVIGLFPDPGRMR